MFSAIFANVVLQDSANAPRSEADPPQLPLSCEFGSGRPDSGRISCPVSTVVELLAPRFFIASADTTALKDEPGGNVWLSALSTSGLTTPLPLSSSSRRFAPFVPVCGATSFGSNDGHDAATFTAPVSTSITTAPPRRPAPSATSAARTRCAARPGRSSARCSRRRPSCR